MPVWRQVACEGITPGRQAISQLLEGLLQRSLADAHALTQHPAAVGGRFRLLELALRHANHERVRFLPCF